MEARFKQQLGRTRGGSAAPTRLTAAPVVPLRRVKSEPIVFSYEKGEISLTMSIKMIDKLESLDCIAVDEEALQVVNELKKQKSNKMSSLTTFPEIKKKSDKRKSRGILKGLTQSHWNKAKTKPSPAPSPKKGNEFIKSTKRTSKNIHITKVLPQSLMEKVASPSSNPSNPVLSKKNSKNKLIKNKSKRELKGIPRTLTSSESLDFSALPKDDDANVLWDNGKIVGLSIEMLLNFMLEDNNWYTYFLMMHNYIISSMDLLGFFKTSLQKKYQSKKRFFDLLLHWSTYNHFDFEEPIFQKAFLDFLEQSAFDMNEKSQIREHVIKPQKIHTVDTVPLPPGYSFNILTFNPKDIAKQITLMDHQMFKEISPNELLKKNFMNEEKSPTIKKFSERFNLITGWIGTLIVSEANVKTRRKLVCHFIVIAIELFELNNFAGLLSCFVGLTQICVSRLQLTWKGVPSNFLDKWKKIEIVCSPLGNFKNLRAIQDKCNMPLVLSPTLFIKDLTANDEIDMYINNNLLNFNKMNQIGKILKNISLAQNSPYDLEHHPVLYNLLLKINTEPADVRDKLSLFIEQVH